MDWQASGDKLQIVIPAFNEGLAIGDVVRRSLPFANRVIVIDDASTDDTGDIAWAAGADVLRHPVNLGQGAALQTGIRHALANGATLIATIDADGQHDPAQIDAAVCAMRESGASIALGSRFKGATVGMPAARRLLLKLAVVFTRLTTGLNLSDAHNGFRVLDASAARKIHIRQNRMAHASEVLEEISRNKLPYVEVPVTIIYTDYSLAKGQANMNSIHILMDLAMGWLRR